MIRWTCSIIFLIAVSANAADRHVDLNAITPAIQKIKSRIGAREPRILSYKNSGHAGESARGFIEERTAAGLSLPEKKYFRDTLAAENDDRVALMRETALVNRIDDLRLV